MSSGFSTDNAPHRVLPQVIEALRHLQEDPDQFARDRDGRYDEPPPPYPESGETTEPPTPTPAVEVDDFRERILRREARSKSIARLQFESQAKRERERLEHQSLARPWGRRQTLPWDDSCDYRANAENNVRSRWIEQGIWGDEWGPAWPRNSHPLTAPVQSNGPFFGSYDPAISESMPGSRWGHEEGHSPEPSPEPERRPLGPWIWFEDSPKPKPPRRKRIIDFPVGARPPAPRPTVRNPEASRPLPQFLYQISKERDWIKDEIDYKTPGKIVDLDTLAHSSVKGNWIKDGIWTWGDADLPGRAWLHEGSDVDPSGDDGEGRLLNATTGFGHRAVGGGDCDNEQHPTNGGNSPNETTTGAQAIEVRESSGRRTRKRVANFEETREEDQEEEALRRSRQMQRSTETWEGNQDRRPPKRRRDGGQDAAASEQSRTKRTRASGKHNDTSSSTRGSRRSERIAERNKMGGPLAETQLQMSRLQPRKKTSKPSKVRQDCKNARSTGKAKPGAALA